MILSQKPSQNLLTKINQVYHFPLHIPIGSLNYGYSLGSLSVTQKQGIITCLPKGDTSRHFLNNWRPISLLNTVYKIGLLSQKPSQNLLTKINQVYHFPLHIPLYQTKA
jgi:hypothetical protein